MATQQSEVLRQHNVQWLNSQPFAFDVAVCLHLPNAFRAEQRRWDERSLQIKLRRFFSRLDSQVLKAAHRHRKKRVPRFVVLEHSASVGWHAHAVLSSATSKMTAEQLCMAVKLVWLQELGQHANNGFVTRLAWAEPLRDSYDHYITKQLYGLTANGYFDEMNTTFE